MQIEAFKMLGIESKAKDISSIEVVSLIEKGFTKENYLHAKKATGFSHDVMASILAISTKTIEKYSDKQRLDNKSSERLLKFAEVIVLGKKAFGSDAIFNDWLKRPLRPLGGKKPIELMVNIYGLDMVKNLIGKIEHGVYS